MIDRNAVPVYSIESDDLVLHALREIAQWIQLRSRRQARVCDVIDAIQNHTAGTFEVVSVRLVLRQVDHFTDNIAGGAIEALDDVHAPLRTPVLGLHRVQHDSPIGMETHPVIREYRIRRVRFISVFDDDYVNTVISQRIDESVKLYQRCNMLFRRGRVRASLETIGFCRLRVALESRRANHQNGRRELRLHSRSASG